ncbi:MAG: heme exporter protein CcmB [bacterium]|nr:heme exporter protein CcmB [bacterium]
MSGLATILRKDLKIELRTKEALSASFVFAVLVLVIFNFTLILTSDEALRLGAGFLWIAFAFSGILSLNRSFALEREEGCTQGLLISPAEPGSIYLAKFLANVILMLTTELLVVPLFVVFFNIEFERVGLLILILALGTIGFSSVGTLFSAIAVHTRMREVLLPLLLLPVTVPVLIASVETTAYALGADITVAFWFRLLIVYDIVFVTASYLVFEYVIQE